MLAWLGGVVGWSAGWLTARGGCMCGIVGLRLKNRDLHPVLGELVVPMLDVLASRGPDSTGAAIYARDVPPGALKYSLCAPAEDYDWAGYVAALEAAPGAGPVELRLRGRDAVLVTPLKPERARPLLAGIDPAVRLFCFGPPSDFYKDVAPPAPVSPRPAVARLASLH